MRVDYCGTYNGSKSKWQMWQALDMACGFLFFCYKIFMQFTLTCTISLLKPCRFQSSNETKYSRVG